MTGWYIASLANAVLACVCFAAWGLWAWGCYLFLGALACFSGHPMRLHRLYVWRCVAGEFCLLEWATGNCWDGLKAACRDLVAGRGTGWQNVGEWFAGVWAFDNPYWPPWPLDEIGL